LFATFKEADAILKDNEVNSGIMMEPTFISMHTSVPETQLAPYLDQAIDPSTEKMK